MLKYANEVKLHDQIRQASPRRLLHKPSKVDNLWNLGWSRRLLLSVGEILAYVSFCFRGSLDQ